MAEVAGYTALGATRTLHHVPKAAGRPLLEGRMLLKAGADDTEEAFTLCLGLTPPGMGPPLHLHEIDDQTHYVVRGTYELQCGPERVVAPPGACVHMPRYTPHTFKNIGDEPAEIVELTIPGGLDRYFDEVEHLGAVATDFDARNEVGRPYGMSFPTDPTDLIEPPLGETRRPIVVVAAGEGRPVELSGHRATCKLAGARTGGLHSLFEADLEPGESVGFSATRAAVVVVWGTVVVESRGDRVPADEGDTVEGLVEGTCSVVNESPASARCLLYSFPAAI